MMALTRRGSYVLLFLAAMSVVVSAAPPDANPATAEQANTPESVFKAFLMAMATGDEDGLHATTLPTSDFDWLTRGEHVPAAEVETFRKEVIDEMVLKRLAANDTFTLPRGKVITVKPEEVDEDHVILLQEGAPLPTRTQKVEGRWKVDARPIIAGRKAADAARRRDAAGKAAPSAPGPKAAQP